VRANNVSTSSDRAEEFARRGCRVYATARNVDKMKTLRSDVERLELDVLSDTSVDHAVKTVIGREGAIDILINNAGAGCTGASLSY
jgi:1-acylglycerone phosphate reductase